MSRHLLLAVAFLSITLILISTSASAQPGTSPSLSNQPPPQPGKSVGTVPSTPPSPMPPAGPAPPSGPLPPDGSSPLATPPNLLSPPSPPGPPRPPGDGNLGSPFTPGPQNQGNNWGNGGVPGNFAPNYGFPNVRQNRGGWYYDEYDDEWYYDDGYDWDQPDWGYGPQAPQYQQRPVFSNQPITILMPEGEPGVCAYVLSGAGGVWNYTIAPGKSQTFNEDRQWMVTFDRGNNLGQQSYNLKPGIYKFRQSNRGWELYRTENPSASQGPPAPM